MRGVIQEWAVTKMVQWAVGQIYLRVSSEEDGAVSSEWD
jgi:hypothetical protein